MGICLSQNVETISFAHYFSEIRDTTEETFHIENVMWHKVSSSTKTLRIKYFTEGR